MVARADISSGRPCADDIKLVARVDVFLSTGMNSAIWAISLFDVAWKKMIHYLEILVYLFCFRLLLYVLTSNR